jgi:uncharacterized Zn finger protein
MDCPNCCAPEAQIETTLNPVTGRTEYHCYVCGYFWVESNDELGGGD